MLFLVRNLMIWLREKSDVTLTMGPFIDSSDGVSFMPGLVISPSDTRIYKQGSSLWTGKDDGSYATYTENGGYDISLSGRDTNTRGVFYVFISVPGSYPVWDTFSVVLGHIYDLVVTGSLTGDIISVMKGFPMLLSAAQPERSNTRWR